MVKLTKLVVSLAASFAAGAIGSLATFPNISTWYATLNKPFFNPPNWLFGPVWTLLYVLIGVSLYLVWNARSKRPKKMAISVFVLQLVLNAMWSLIFFGLHMTLGGVLVIIMLLGTIVGSMILFWPISKTAAYLLIPYAAWVSFATALNIAIAILN